MWLEGGNRRCGWRVGGRRCGWRVGNTRCDGRVGEEVWLEVGNRGVV